MTATATKPAKKAVKTSARREVPDQKTKEIRWTPRKMSLLKGLRKLGAKGSSTARTREEVAKAAGLTVEQVAHQTNPAFDLAQQEYFGRTKNAEEAFYRYFLTPKGQKKADALTAEKAAAKPAAKTN